MRAQATGNRVGELPFTGILRTPFAALGIRVEDGVLRSIDFLALDQPELAPRDAASETVMGQIQRYLDDPRWIFTSPAAPAGTAFQNRVWAALRRIASGDTRSYGGVARELSTSPRAVGGACRANPIPLIIPCHRVVSVSGVGGFDGMAQGRGPSIKSWLLEHEGYRKGGARRVA